MKDALVHRVRPAAGDPAGALVLLHGRGADERDLYPLLDLLDPENKLLGVAPRGPLSLPPGGAHWYRLKEVGYPDPPTFHETFAVLDGWLAAVARDAGIGQESILLAGFSQGAVMAYALALGAGRPRPRALIAFSGFIPTVPGLQLDLSGVSGMFAAIGHGTFDPVIEVDWSRRARRRLEDAGAAVLYRESPMAHAIDPRFVREVARALGA